MVTYDDEPTELVLSLTVQTVARLDSLSGPEGVQGDETRESLALVWLRRWSRRADKQLSYFERFGPGTESVTITVEAPLLKALRDYGIPMRWWPDQVASAVVNDCGADLSWRKGFEIR